MRLQRRAFLVRGRRYALHDRLEQRQQVVSVGQRAVGWLGQRGDARLGRCVHHGHLEQRVDVEVRHVVVQVRGQRQQQVVGLVDHFDDARVGAVHLVDDDDDGQVRRERLAQHKAGLREGTLGGIDQEHHAVHHRQSALDLAAEVGVAGGVDHVDRDALGSGGHARVADGRVLGQDRDALLAFKVAGVHRAVLDVGVIAVRATLPQHGIDKSGLAMVDVGDDGDVAQV